MADDWTNDRESPAHRVELRPYFLARYPVTVAQWRLYYEAVQRGAWTPTQPDGLACALLGRDSLRGAPTQPVGHVSWYDALDYCRWLTTELRDRITAESEYPASSRSVPLTLARVLGRGGQMEWPGGRGW